MENKEESEVSNLQCNFVKQQAQISVLKELVRKTEMSNEKTTYTQEKVRNIAQRLTNIKSKVKTRHNHDLSFGCAHVEEDKVLLECSTNSSSDIKIISEKPGSEKFILLRQQINQNKLKMAERENTKKEIEEMVFQLKAKIDSTQLSLDKSSELGRSMTELSTFSGTPVTKFKSSADLNFNPLNIDKERIKFLENRIRFLDKQIGNEKDIANNCQCKNEIKLLDAQESLREKEHIILGCDENNENLIGNSTNKTVQSQSNGLQINDNYLQQMKFLRSEILNLKEINNILEQTRFDLTIKNSKLELEIQDVHRSHKEVEELNKSLQNKVFNLMNENSEIKEKDCATAERQNNYIIQDNTDKINSLLICLEMEQKKVQNEISKNQEYEDKLIEKDIEYNVLKANFLVLEEKIKSPPKNMFSKITDKAGEIEINKLKQQLDDSNKSMIKLKLKAKQLQKQIDGFGKISNINNELIVLLEQNQKLQQKVNCIEAENHQLRLSCEDESNIINEQIYKKVDLLEKKSHNQNLCSGYALEDQNMKMDENLHQLQSIKEKLYTLHKKIIELIGEKTLISDFEKITLEELILNLSTNIETLNCCKESSIKISAPLVQQEKDCTEFEESNLSNIYDKNQFKYKTASDSEIKNHDLNDSLVKLTEESSELMYKIELFAIERREVLDKMEALSNENKDYIMKIALLEQERVHFQENVAKLRYVNSNLENDMYNISDYNEILKKEIADVRNQENTMNTQNISNIPSTLLTETLIKTCTNHLDILHNEIKNYKKRNDTNSKLQPFTKLVEVAIPELKNLIEFIKMAEFVSGGQQLQENEIQYANCSPSTIFNSQIQLLKKTNENLESLNKELQDQLIESVNEKQVIQNNSVHLTTELNNMQQTVNTLNSQIMDLYDTIEKNTANLLKKDNVVVRQREIIDLNISEINTLRNENKALYEKHTLYESELRSKIIELEKNNAALDMKTVNQLDKLKKFAANIKKKSIEYNNLEEKVKFLEEKRNCDKKLLEAHDDLKNQINYYKIEIEKINLSKTHIIHNFMDEKQLLQNNLSAIKMELDTKNQKLENSQFKFESIKNEIDLLKNKELIQLQAEISKQNHNINEKENCIEGLLNEIKLKNIELEKLQIQNNEKADEIVKLKFDNTNLKLVNSSNSQIINESEFKYNEVQKMYAQILHKYEKDLQSFHRKIFKINTLFELVAGKLNEYINSIEILELEHKKYKDIISELKDSVISFDKGIVSDIKIESFINRLYKLLNYSGMKFVFVPQNESLETANISNLSQQFCILKFEETEKHKDVLNVPALIEVPKEIIRDTNNETKGNSYQIEVSEPDLRRTRVKQNQTDDQALIENDNKRLRDILNKKECEIAMYKRNISELQSSILVPINLSPGAQVTNSITVNVQDQCDVLTKEIKELKIVLYKKDEEINSLQTDLKQLYENHPISSSEIMSNEYANMFSNRSALLFSDVSTIQSINKKDKIEDLERKICDLEIYIANLENQIKILKKTSKNLINDSITPNETDVDKIETVIVPHKAYLCGPGVRINNCGYNDDASQIENDQKITVTNEALLAMTKLYEAEKNIVQGFEIRVEELELEQKRLQEEKQALQIKSAKMMKKLKEYKVKAEQQNQFISTKKSKNVYTPIDLDLATQREMKNEIYQLEKTIAECVKNLENEKNEKTNLLKRINTLVATNERMVEIKGNQDVEISNLQRNISELNLKLTPFIDSQSQQAEIKNKQNMSYGIDDMNREIHLKSSIDEQQSMLDKEKASKLILENQLKSLQNKIVSLERYKYLAEETDYVQFTETDSEYASTIVQLEKDSYNIMNNFCSFRNEFQMRLNENLKLNIDLQLDTRTNNVVEDVQLNSGIRYTVHNDNNIPELMSQLQHRKIENTQYLDKNQTNSLQETYDRNSLFEKEFTVHNFVEQLKTDRENIISNDVWFLVNENDRKWNKKIRDFAEIWKMNILNNKSISQENINILQNKLDELQSTQTKDSPINILSNLINVEEENLDLRNMKKVLKDQELEIIALKDKMALRSAQRDPYAQISYSLESSPLAAYSNICNKNSELDLTLYMLHQRDMRCEELQLELINLLEERDTLQLKLSSAIRQNEDFKHKFVNFCEDKPLIRDKSNETNRSLWVNLEEQKFDASTKAIKDRNREVDLEIEQGISNIPTEATSNEAISNAKSTQSTSTLLNWLWGKSLSST